jgi:ABC-type ATPase involved in cell division
MIATHDVHLVDHFGLRRIMLDHGRVAENEDEAGYAG